MGFLSSIITEVKENPNLSSYKTTLNEAVNELNKNLNKGKKGLEAVIGPVKEGIKGWLGEVEKKNNDVTKYIDVLKNDTTNAATGIEKWKNQDFDEASKKHGELHNWIKSIKELSNQPYYAIHAVEYVDEKLRNNLLPHINLLNNAIDTFKQNTVEDYDGLRTVCEKVAAKSNEIIDQANLVTKTAEKKIELMTSQLDNTITALDEHVQKAVEGLENATHELNKWSENQTDSSLHKALKQCAEVVKELDYKENKNTFYIQLAAIDAAKDVVAEVQGTLSSVNNRLMIWITKAAFLVSQSLRFVATILDELNGEDGSHNYVKQIKDAAGKLYKDALKLNGAMRAAHKHISEKVRAALEAFGEVDKAVRKDLAQFRDLIKAEVGVYFAQLGAVEYGVVKQSGDVSQLDQKVGAKFREWLRQASSTSTVITHTKIQTDLRYLKKSYNVNAKSSTLEEISAFAAMGEDAKAQIEKDYGSDIKDVPNPEQRMASYNAHDGKQKVTNALAAIKSDTNGLLKIEEVKDGEGTRIDILSLRALHQQTETSVKNLTALIRKYAGDESLKNDGVQQYLTKCRELIVKHEDTIEVEGVRIPGLQKIKQDISGQQSLLSKLIQPVGAAVEAIKMSITKASKIVDDATRSETIKGYITQLQSEMRELKKSLNSLNAGELTKEMQAVRAEFVKTQDKIILYIKLVSEQSKSLAIEAAIDIKKSALSQFATSKAAVLQKLKQLVEKEKGEIERIIEEDLESGLKGMMKKMKEKESTLEAIEQLVTVRAPPPPTVKSDGTKLREMSGHFKSYYDAVHNHIKTQVEDPPNQPTKTVTNSPPTDQPTDPATQLTKIKTNFDKLLGHLIDAKQSKKYNYDKTFVDLLNSLKNATNDLSPSAFANPRHPELLDALKKGLEGVC
ncbi:hypothetical protein, conserved, partial [Babesia bigemina]